MRYIFAGAERVRDETRRIWMEKFGLRILEGYGATECSPVIAVNSPMHFKAGSVGRLLPGMHCRLEPVPGVDEGGRLLVCGPNVMLGYLRSDRPGALERSEEHTSELQSLMRISYAVFCLKKKNNVQTL